MASRRRTSPANGSAATLFDMRATACWIALALLAACGRKEPPPAVPVPVAEGPGQPEPEPSPVVEVPPKEDTAREETYHDAVEAKARARALRTRLGDERTALAGSLAAAEGPQRDVLLLVHQLTAKEVFDPDHLMAIDTSLERADALFMDGRHAEARDAFVSAAGEIEALLGRLARSEPKARTLLDLNRADQALAAARAWFEERKLPPPAALDRAQDDLTEGRGLVESGDFDGARRDASEARAICDQQINRAETLAAALKAAREQRGPAEVALGAWEKYSAGTGGETDLSRTARATLAEGDRLLAANDPGGAMAAYQEAALAFETAIEAVETAEKARLASLRVKETPPPEPPVVKTYPRVAAAVMAALDWLARHQDDDGKWDTSAFTKHDPGAERTGGGQAEYDVGVTALALLAFLEAGYGEGKEGYYAINIEQALRFLRLSQDEGGVYGGQASQHFIYNHAIATLAVCEAYRRSRDPALRQSAARAVDFIASARSAGMGWRYEPRGKESDTSVTAWCMRALVAAKEVGIEVDPESFRGALAWVDKMTEPSSGQVGYNFPGGAVSRPEGRQLKFPAGQSQAMTAAGLLVRILCGENPRMSPICRKHHDLILEHPPRWDDERGSIDMYYWYVGTVAMRHVGGSHWSQWRNPVQEVCLGHQVREGVQAGSWDPAGVWGEEGGRVYATAMMTLTLIESAPAIAR